MIHQEIVSKILWSTIEDFVGLWEILWELNSLQQKTNSRDDAIKILNFLQANKLITFYFSKWGSDELIKISEEEVSKLIANDTYWSPPELGQECIKVGSTKEGEDVYNSGDLSYIRESKKNI